MFARCDTALRGFERAAEQAVSGIGAVADARREVAAGDWNDAALERIRHVLRRIDEARQVLDDDALPNDELGAVREGLKQEGEQAAGQLAAATRDVLGRLDAADLPVEVLARALDEVRLAQTQGHEAAAVSLERLRVVAALPWTARVPERVDIEAAMAELEAAYAGRPEIKARIRRFLATRRLTSGTWIVEGCDRTVRSCCRDPSSPVAVRRFVVRSAGPATRAPILCFAGPPGGGKTFLAKLIAGILRRPAVTVALGGIWDETAMRGLSTTFRTPEAGRIVRALLEARVRNPVIILDEIDKVGGRTENHGDPSAALLEVLDPEQERALPRRLPGCPGGPFRGPVHRDGQRPGWDSRTPAGQARGARGARIHGRGEGRHCAAKPVERATRGQRAERRWLLDSGGEASGGAGGGVRRAAGPQAAGGGGARRRDGDGDAAGGRSGGGPRRRRRHRDRSR